MKLPLTYNANLFSIRRIHVSDLIETVLGLYVRQKSHNDRNLAAHERTHVAYSCLKKESRAGTEIRSKVTSAPRGTN